MPLMSSRGGETSSAEPEAALAHLRQQKRRDFGGQVRPAHPPLLTTASRLGVSEMFLDTNINSEEKALAKLRMQKQRSFGSLEVRPQHPSLVSTADHVGFGSPHTTPSATPSSTQSAQTSQTSLWDNMSHTSPNDVGTTSRRPTRRHYSGGGPSSTAKHLNLSQSTEPIKNAGGKASVPQPTPSPCKTGGVRSFVDRDDRSQTTSQRLGFG
eukprot:CAMPEP_0114559054 /NCGR_PEP_ID=MMETSP0114-20121206/10720_1 /TAXON_ID=31324 /ORGANISM="Goniomonas sp, Strain m" /LENGTH=210 /DNA_ID=CAMNT_0001744505 /DNA_START=22 /DNA_END=657 /DNA_ORIENTATION=-